MKISQRNRIKKEKKATKSKPPNRTNIKYLTEQEEKQLLALLDRRKDAERDYMVIHLFLKSGLRLQELSALNNADLRNVEVLHVRKETAKRGSERDVPLNKRLRAHVKAYFKIKWHLKEDLAGDAPFFVARGAIRLSPRAIYNLVKKWLKISRLDHRYSPHSFRHSFAKRVLERYENSSKALPTVQRLLGHKSLASTGVYLEPGKEDLLEAVEAI